MKITFEFLNELRNMIEYIDSDIRKKTHPSEICIHIKKFNYTEKQLNFIFNNINGTTFFQFVKNRKLVFCENKIETENKNISLYESYEGIKNYGLTIKRYKKSHKVKNDLLENDIDFLEKLLKNPMISMININNQQLIIKLDEKFCLLDFLCSETFFVSKRLKDFNNRTEDDVKIALAMFKKHRVEIEKSGRIEYIRMSFEELDLEIAELGLYNIKNPIESEKCYIYRRELLECFKPFVRKNLKKIVEVLRIVIPKEAAEDVFIINYAKKIIPGFDLEKNCITVKKFKETTGKSTEDLFDIVWEGLNLGILRLNPAFKDI